MRGKQSSCAAHKARALRKANRGDYAWPEESLLPSGARINDWSRTIVSQSEWEPLGGIAVPFVAATSTADPR